MKKIVITLFFIILFSQCIFAQKRLGAFGTYGFRNELMGIGFNGQFFLKEKTAITPEFNYNFPKFTTTESGTATIEEVYNTWSIAFDFNHYFVKKDKFEFYGLIGLNLGTEKAKNTYDNNPTTITKHTELGLNLGLGTNFNASGKFVPYLQFKYEANSFQLVLHAGVRYNL